MDKAPGGQDRTALFQKLKPCCVKISQLAIREAEAPDAGRELAELTRKLLEILEEQTETHPQVLDDKLAEYVFFPLYHIFRQMDRYPVLVVENCVRCLRLLIVHGWKHRLSAKLVQQIFSLLTFIIDGTPGNGSKPRVPEETILEAFRAQTALLRAAASSASAASGLAEQDSIPVLGHGITVMLDGAAEGVNFVIQCEALSCLQVAYTAIREHEALASFLPGTVSTLAKILSTPNRYKTTVLTESIETLRIVLLRVLGDVRLRSVLARSQSQDESDATENASKILSPAWLKATVSQVKLALLTILKLRKSDSRPVQETLERLCVNLLDECHATLSNCTVILTETAVILYDDADEADLTRTSLLHLVSIYPALGETVKTIVYSWISSLPRQLQSGDEEGRKVSIHNLAKGVELFRKLGLESTTLDESLAAALKDGMACLMTSSPHQADHGVQIQLHDGKVSVGTAAAGDQAFQPVLLARQSQRELRAEVTSLIDRLGSASDKCRLAANLLESTRGATSTDQAAAMWLSFELVKVAESSSTEVDAFLDTTALSGSTEDADAVFDDLYSIAVQTLESQAAPASVDWHMEALSLEVTAYAAQKSGRAFRPELIDVLFPVATYLGSDNRTLQQHAIATLNSIATSVEYQNVSDLIVDNVDYMVNSVALRLNTLDVSPASLQVLLMMIRLAGPRVVPFLDDVVESIFAALDNYHGYVSFVESLFAILKEVVDQASRTNQNLLTDRESAPVDHKKKPHEDKGLDGLLDFIDKRAERQARDAAEAAHGLPVEGHPKEPWTSETEPGDENGNSADEPIKEQSDDKSPHSPTYQLLLRIATLTQHYLTSPTPTLRRSLLELLTSASSTLGGDEDSFLPLVNAIWPVVVSRLYDQEAYVTIEACNALSGLCEAAGDFLTTRFKTEWGDRLHDWCRKVKRQAFSNIGRSRAPNTDIRSEGDTFLIPIRSAEGITGREVTNASRQQHQGSLGQHSSPTKIWDAAVKLLTSIVTFVHIDDAMFDQILDLLSDTLENNQQVREALETINADAVWLVRYEKGLIEPLPTPELEGFTFASMDRRPQES
ncbi:hypothetical protein HIM_07763 [Hirsutella minnesotensis 3608]|uniref:TEL2-interacting protein 1 n=1 Tax=Hirsutella minnesotensis 3608 TaxID=1043627 RepID=A0A0F8A421_9HYPO|nr:hypothetical protein HIM_07763 [Hirsutella minnesotensis 3608]